LLQKQYALFSCSFSIILYICIRTDIVYLCCQLLQAIMQRYIYVYAYLSRRDRNIWSINIQMGSKMTISILAPVGIYRVKRWRIQASIHIWSKNDYDTESEREKKNDTFFFAEARSNSKCVPLSLLLLCILHQDQIRVHARALPAEMRACAFNCSLVSCYWPRDCVLSRQRISLTYTSTLSFERD
jgi:hypothetical protein